MSITISLSVLFSLSYMCMYVMWKLEAHWILFELPFHGSLLFIRIASIWQAVYNNV